MSRRRFLVYVAIFVTGALALFGFATFAVGILVEFFATRGEPLPRSLSPTMQLALAGLCVAALMFAMWVGLVALLIARQTRMLGSGYADAYRLIEEFKFNEAIPLLERSLREGKVTPDVLMLLTSAYAYSGQFAKAQAAADRAVQLFPDDPGSYVTLANGYRLQAAYDEAASALKAAIERAPDQPALWAELGFVEQLAGNAKSALESFQKAAQHALPAMYGVRVYYHLAKAYQAAGDANEAVKSTARMMSARDGLDVWKSGLNALTGTAYGSSLRYEISAIEQALADADAGNLG
jgi:tetratricopeptide (TPR) repeat protein